MARLLGEIGARSDVLERVCHIVGHHHTREAVGGPDFQIFWESDALLNIPRKFERQRALQEREGQGHESSAGEAKWPGKDGHGDAADHGAYLRSSGESEKERGPRRRPRPFIVVCPAEDAMRVPMLTAPGPHFHVFSSPALARASWRRCLRKWTMPCSMTNSAVVGFCQVTRIKPRSWSVRPARHCSV